MYRHFLKIIFDFIIGLIGFILLSPIFCIALILLTINNQGKPFFFQKRPGKDEKIFKVIKFKTMNDKKDKWFYVLREVLSDKGARGHIIKKYIPIINNLINEHLQAMDFFVSFHLDEEFNETVKSRHRDTFNYNSFSEGEKLRIDLAILFTWRTIAKMKNSVNTNLLILDEIFDSSLDQQGTDDFFKIVNKLKNENIFIISHKGDILFDKFTNILKFEKYKNFTRLQNT